MAGLAGAGVVALVGTKLAELAERQLLTVKR